VVDIVEALDVSVGTNAVPRASRVQIGGGIRTRDLRVMRGPRAVRSGSVSASPRLIDLLGFPQIRSVRYHCWYHDRARGIEPPRELANEELADREDRALWVGEDG
jgi:hypothetical protein